LVSHKFKIFEHFSILIDILVHEILGGETTSDSEYFSLTKTDCFLDHLILMALFLVDDMRELLMLVNSVGLLNTFPSEASEYTSRVIREQVIELVITRVSFNSRCLQHDGIY